MKSNRLKKIFRVFSSVILINLSLIMYAAALEVETHVAINSYIADENSAIYGSYLHSYLKNNLGMQNGVKTEFNSKMAKEWISDGGKYEDKPSLCIPYWRSRNHFHNPIDNSGFSGIWDTGFLSGMSAIDWALQPADSQSCGYYSWADIRSYYLQALTATAKITRDNNFAQTFRGIGQQMHLVQDMSVPEHTRNNGHYFYYDYEVWAKGSKISDFSAMPFTPSAAFPLSINNLFDTDQYNGSNPDITAQSTIGLAEYSNANFLSPDTIFTGFDYPTYSGMTARIESDPATGKNILYLDKIGNGEDINYFARASNFYNYLPANYKKLALTLKDEKVYASYASFLMPRVIGYSSQVLSYFFRGKLDVEMVQGALKVKNTSTETMDGGQFELYYDNANEERNLVTSVNVSTLAPGAEQTISFSQPAGAVSYMLVYSGKLGDEPNAVIGKKYSGYWEPWNGPDVDSQNPWEIYNWPESGNGATWEITADPLAPEERPKVLHFNVTGVYPYGSYSLLATNGGTHGIVPLDKPIPIDSIKKLFFNIRSLSSGSGFSQANLFVVDSNGIRKQWYFNGYESYAGANSSNHPVWIGDNDGTVGLDLSPLSGSIIYFQFEVGVEPGVTVDFWSDFIDIRQVSE